MAIRRWLAGTALPFGKGKVLEFPGSPQGLDHLLWAVGVDGNRLHSISADLQLEPDVRMNECQSSSTGSGRFGDSAR